MEFLPKRQARFTFLQYVLSQKYIENTNLDDVITIFREKYFHYEPDINYLNQLVQCYEKHKLSLQEKLVDLFHHRVTFDNAVLALALCSLCEMEINSEKKLVVSEYVKLCFVTENNTKLLNGILHKYLDDNKLKLP